MIVTKLERVDDFISRLKTYKKSDTGGIWGVCLAEIKHLRTGTWTPAGANASKAGYAEATVRSVLSDYRNAVRTTLGETHPALRYLKPSKALQESVKQAQSERVKEMHSNLRPIDPTELVGAAEAIISKIERDPSAIAPLIVAAALLLLTGRRPWEILWLGNFQPITRASETLFDKSIPTKERWSLMFSGQAKTRGAESAQTDPYEIPVLIEPARIGYAFKNLTDRYHLTDLRAKFNNDKEFYDKSHNRYSKTLGEYAKANFHDDARGTDEDGRPKRKPISPSDLRAAYATIAYERFAPSNVSLNAYIARILGHSQFDFVTSLSYFNFYPIGTKRDFDQQVRSGTKEAIAELEKQKAAELDEKRRGWLQDRINKFHEVL
jgi:integrase